MVSAPRREDCIDRRGEGARLDGIGGESGDTGEWSDLTDPERRSDFTETILCKSVLSVGRGGSALVAYKCACGGRSSTATGLW